VKGFANSRPTRPLPRIETYALDLLEGPQGEVWIARRRPGWTKEGGGRGFGALRVLRFKQWGIFWARDGLPLLSQIFRTKIFTVVSRAATSAGTSSHLTTTPPLMTLRASAKYLRIPEAVGDLGAGAAFNVQPQLAARY